MARTLATNTATNDLFLDANKNIAVYVTQADYTKQLCQNYLQTFLGECFTNQSLGVDYFGILLNEFTSLQDKISELRRVLLTVPNVLQVLDVKYSQDKATGIIQFEIEILTSFGTLSLNDLKVGV